MYALCHDICVSLIFVSNIPALFFYGIFVTWRCKFFYSIFYKVFYVAKKYKLIFINVFLNVSSTFLNVSSVFFYVSYK